MTEPETVYPDDELKTKHPCPVCGGSLYYSVVQMPPFPPGSGVFYELMSCPPCAQKYARTAQFAIPPGMRPPNG